VRAALVRNTGSAWRVAGGVSGVYSGERTGDCTGEDDDEEMSMIGHGEGRAKPGLAWAVQPWTVQKWGSATGMRPTEQPWQASSLNPPVGGAGGGDARRAAALRRA